MSKIIFYDINRYMCEEWSKCFEGMDDVQVLNIPFKDVEATYVVTAGNSYGIMTGGIDLAVRNYFGYDIQDAIQEYLFFLKHNKLKVGDNIIIKTNDVKKPNLVYAATMEYPRKIDSRIVYKTMYNILKSCYKSDGNIAVCGLGTCTGQVPYNKSAEACYKAYNNYLRKK